MNSECSLRPETSLARQQLLWPAATTRMAAPTSELAVAGGGQRREPGGRPEPPPFRRCSLYSVHASSPCVRAFAASAR